MWSSLTQPGSSQPTPRPRSSWGSQLHPGDLLRGQGTGSRQDPRWGAARLRFLQAFPEQIPPENKPVSKFLGKRLQLRAGATRGSRPAPRSSGRVARDAPVPRLPRCPWPVPRSRGSAGLDAAPSPARTPPLALGFLPQPRPRAARVTQPPAAHTAVTTLTPRGRASAVPTAPRRAGLPPQPAIPATPGTA